MYDFRWLKDIWQGRRTLGVPAYKTAALAALTATLTPLFNVAGGRVRLVSLYGQVVQVPAAAAGTILLRLRLTPTIVGAVTDMCADSADVVALAQYSLLTITGAVAVAMGITAGATGVQVLHSFATNQQSLEPGVIGLLQTNAGGNVTAGILKWTIHYLPLDPGAVLVPA
jgi:hypothetical protein